MHQTLKKNRVVDPRFSPTASSRSVFTHRKRSRSDPSMSRRRRYEMTSSVSVFRYLVSTPHLNPSLTRDSLFRSDVCPYGGLVSGPKHPSSLLRLDDFGFLPLDEDRHSPHPTGRYGPEVSSHTPTDFRGWTTNPPGPRRYLVLFTVQSCGPSGPSVLSTDRVPDYLRVSGLRDESGEGPRCDQRW